MVMPRPKMLRRCLQSISSLGVKNIYIINSKRVEKSFWQTPFLSEQTIENELILGLEQARDTVLPKVHVRKLFKPFVEDELGDVIANTQALVAHPSGIVNCPIDIQQPTTLVIGPEGGFSNDELIIAKNAKFTAVSLGDNRLRTETAGVACAMLHNLSKK